MFSSVEMFCVPSCIGVYKYVPSSILLYVIGEFTGALELLLDEGESSKWIEIMCFPGTIAKPNILGSMFNVGSISLSISSPVSGIPSELLISLAFNSKDVMYSKILNLGSFVIQRPYFLVHNI